MEIRKGPCPFCGSGYYFKEPSGRYTCFSCFSSGDNIEEKITGNLHEPDSQDILEDACRIFQQTLLITGNDRYIKTRGINKYTVEDFRLGYADGNLYDQMKNKYSDEELIEAGLIKRNAGKVYDTFKNRLMFPILSPGKGNVIGFGGRLVYKSDVAPKYLNTSENDVFKKRNNLFGIYGISNEKKTNHVFLVEGYMDVVSLHQSGVKNAVAALGTAVTENHCVVLRNAGIRKVTICLDSDAPGLNAAIKAAKVLERNHIKFDFLSVPEGKDPDEYLKTHTSEDFYLLPTMDRREFLLKNYKTLGLKLEDLPLMF